MNPLSRRAELKQVESLLSRMLTLALSGELPKGEERLLMAILVSPGIGDA